VAGNGPAARAGLRQGDVLVAANGQTLRAPAELVTAVERAGVGGNLRLTVSRGGQQFQVNVVPAQLARS
jgi:S1-C subfamily serine protease